MMNSNMFLLAILCCCFGNLLAAEEPSGSCFNRFEYEYNVLQKILQLETKVAEQEALITTLTQSLEDTTSRLDETRRNRGDSTYIRWGRKSCPEGGLLVYHGYAAGSLYTQTGSGSNRLCLPTDPMWKEYVVGDQSTGSLYGSEYQVSSHPFLKHLHDQDVPCAVCRIPRSTVLMIPGRYECYENFTLEYSGYLMSGYQGHASSLDYVCVDGEPEALDGGHADHNGALMYLVEAQCGSLPCPPYYNAREVTCAMCSYAPQRSNVVVHP